MIDRVVRCDVGVLAGGCVHIRLFVQAVANLAGLPRDVLTAMRDLAAEDICAVAASCTALHAAFASTLARAQSKFDQLQRLCDKVNAARTPAEPDETTHVGQRILVSDRRDLRPRLLLQDGAEWRGLLVAGETDGMFGGIFWPHSRLEAADVDCAMRCVDGHVTEYLFGLNLSCNRIGDAGVTSVASVVPVLRRLRELDLQECGLTDAGVCALALALTDDSHAPAGLRRLCVGSNAIGDTGCEALATALVQSPRLRDRAIKDTGGARTGLSILQLGDCSVGDAGVTALANALDAGAMPHGLQIWLAACPVSAVGRFAIGAAASRQAASRSPHDAPLRVCW